MIDGALSKQKQDETSKSLVNTEQLNKKTCQRVLMFGTSVSSS